MRMKKVFVLAMAAMTIAAMPVLTACGDVEEEDVIPRDVLVGKKFCKEIGNNTYRVIEFISDHDFVYYLTDYRLEKDYASGGRGTYTHSKGKIDFERSEISTKYVNYRFLDGVYIESMGRLSVNYNQDLGSGFYDNIIKDVYEELY